MIVFSQVSNLIGDTFQHLFLAFLRPDGDSCTFLFCDYAAEVWEGIKATYGITLCRHFFRNPRQLLFDILMRSTDTQATAITITIWHIWEAEWCKK
jgi:hypothetical protein